jgi:hypothetical protein
VCLEIVGTPLAFAHRRSLNIVKQKQALDLFLLFLFSCSFVSEAGQQPRFFHRKNKLKTIRTYVRLFLVFHVSIMLKWGL